MLIKSPLKMFIKKISITLCLLAISQISLAQPDNEDPEPVPIDGGVSILVAAGVAYGVKKVRDYKKEKN